MNINHDWSNEETKIVFENLFNFKRKNPLRLKFSSSDYDVKTPDMSKLGTELWHAFIDQSLIDGFSDPEFVDTGVKITREGKELSEPDILLIRRLSQLALGRVNWEEIVTVWKQYKAE